MKTQRRHELHTNVLAEWLGKHLERIQPIVGWVVAGVVALVLAILAYSYFTSRSETQILDGWTAIAKYGNEASSAANNNDTPRFNDATRNLAQVVSDYSGTPVATFAEATLADIHLARGQALMWSNRPEALQSLREAVTRYNSAIDSTQEPLLRNRLRMNLGTTSEWMFQVDEAKRAYQQVEEGVFEPAAKKALAALERAEAEQLFQRLEKYEPATPQTTKAPETEFGKEGENLFDRIKDLERPSEGTGAAAQPTGKPATPAKEAGAETGPSVQDSTPAK